VTPLELELASIASVSLTAARDRAAALAETNQHDIEPGDFRHVEHGRIWGAVRELLRAGKTPDLFAVEHMLPGVGRPLLVQALLGADVGYRGDPLPTMADVAQRRRITAALDRVRAVVNDTTTSLTAGVAEAHRAFNTIQVRDTNGGSAEQDLISTIDHLEAVAEGRVEQVVATGIADLDARTGGLQKTLTVIGSLPGVGKSALLASIVRNIARRGVKVGLFSLEDERTWLTRRILADVCEIPLFVLQTRPLSAAQRARLSAGGPDVYELLRSVFIEDRPAMTCDDLVAGARQMIVRHGVKALIVDHLGEIRVKRSERHDLDIAEVLQQLRALSKIYRVPIVVACHLKRGAVADDPKLSDFAFSSAVERMARVALALTRTSDDELRCHVLKQTNGPSGVCFDLEFHKLAGMVRNGEPSPTPEEYAR
jgi:replicative DNA helicase